MNLLLIESASNYIKKYIDEIPQIAMILGSGLNDLADEVGNPQFLEYKSIPGFPSSTAPGHASRLVWGTLSGTPLILFQGRFHLYEGYSPEEVTFPISVLSRIGCKILIISNAAGGINRSYIPGDLMLIRDHINFSGKNPLIGGNSRFSNALSLYDVENYSVRLMTIMKKAAENLNLKLKTGTYAWMCGPSFESASEIQMLRIIGADAVGMSTVPEVIAAAHSGLEVLGISYISNMAAGILDQPITSDEVFEAGIKVKSRLSDLIKEFLELLRGASNHVDG